jgi:hypothetical protein
MSVKTGWAMHVAGIGRREMYTRFSWGTQKERGHYEELDVGERIIQCVPLAGSPGKCWFTKRKKVRYLFMSCNEVRLCVLGIRKKEVGNTKR